MVSIKIETFGGSRSRRKEVLSAYVCILFKSLVNKLITQYIRSFQLDY